MKVSDSKDTGTYVLYVFLDLSIKQSSINETYLAALKGASVNRHIEFRRLRDKLQVFSNSLRKVSIHVRFPSGIINMFTTLVGYYTLK